MKKRTLLLLLMAGFIFHQAIKINNINSAKWSMNLYEEWGTPDPGLDVADVVTSQHTVLHRSIANTGIAMIVPDDYQQAPSFQSFFRDRDTSITIKISNEF